MEKQHILALVGISASGKSTIAKNLMVYNSGNYVIVNRDGIRKTLFGFEDEDLYLHYRLPQLSKKEALVTSVQNFMIQSALDAGYSVIVDNTNLQKKYITALQNFGVPVECKLIHCPVEVAIIRDEKRAAKVGEAVIRKQQKSLEKLIKTGIFEV